MTYILSSPRLGMRNWLPSDHEPFAQLCADPNVMEYFPNTLTPEETSAMIERLKGYFLRFGCTFYAVDELSTGNFIGMVGIILQTHKDFQWAPEVEIGWRLALSAQGKGYATEAALACKQYAFNQLLEDGTDELRQHWDGKSIVAITPVQNAPSRRVMEKLDMHHESNFDHPLLEQDSPLLNHVLYRVSKTS